MEIKSKCLITGCKKFAEAKGYCSTHYMRVRRHGTAEQTRPEDWGSRAKHPLYKFWKSVRRHRHDDVCKEWLGDFWSFANEVKERPDDGARHELYALDDQRPIGPGNWVWRRCKERVETENWNSYMRDYQRRRRSEDPLYQKRQDLKKYGVTIDWYHDTLEKQGHVCRICKQGEPAECKGKRLALAVDHDHDTGKVRGLLCSQCNRAIGLFRHDPKRLVAAIEYLDAFPSG